MEDETISAERSPRPQVILFDAVGTLIHPRPSAAEIYAEVGAQHGFQLAPEEIRPRFAAALRHHADPGPTNEDRERRRWLAIVADVFGLAPNQAGPLFEQLWEHFADPGRWAVYADVAETLTEIARRGVRVGIASNFDQRLPRICQTLAPLAQIDPIFTSASVGYTKPSPQFYAAVQLRLGVPAEAIWLVGDDPIHDAQAPRLAGWHGLLICRNGPRPPGSLADLRQVTLNW